ncbi:glycosyltransferase [Gilvimarinus sp. SDUM040013]|uniref:Glycosyltransferase n=1 Tax=Gilvimarinus gilvus TaxID=3058038 RepID=A0ABU4RTM4_9GAMM|nr:glycosyltransferase [Gilvimarinus sp. SDUM040013]MDO3386843.1 glycosyltransferase [Gilvimarinus sp. SDUM040013]MDX6848227.1 glycosyltransferase [Gilvimarinus sp. SDUM040013]
MTDNLPKQAPRIGIVIGTLEPGGAARMAVSLLRALLLKGTHARLYCLDTDQDMALADEDGADLRQHITILGRHGSRRSTLRKALAIPFLWGRLEREVRTEKLDLVISFMERANILSLLGSRRTPRVLSIRKHIEMALADKTPLKRKLVYWGYRFLLTRAQCINFNSAESAESFKNLYPRYADSLSVIHNFIGDDVHRRANEPLSAEDEQLFDEQTLLTCGRLVPVKGQASLLRAFSSVAHQNPKAKLVLLGGGPLEDELKTLAVRLELSDRIFFLGHKKNPYPYIKRCGVFVLSSFSEGFPNALLEAMALGKAVISTDCYSGPRELLAPDTNPCVKTNACDYAAYGVLTPPLSQRVNAPSTPLNHAELELADAMKAVLDDKTLKNQLGEKAALRAQHFNSHQIMNKWQALIDQITEKGNSGRTAPHSQPDPPSRKK